MTHNFFTQLEVPALRLRPRYTNAHNCLGHLRGDEPQKCALNIDYLYSALPFQAPVVHGWVAGGSTMQWPCSAAPSMPHNRSTHSYEGIFLSSQ